MNWRLIFFFWPVSPELQEIKKHAIAFSKQVKQTTTRYHTKGLGSRGDPVLSDPAPRRRRHGRWRTESQRMQRSLR